MHLNRSLQFCAGKNAVDGGFCGLTRIAGKKRPQDSPVATGDCAR